MLHMGIFTFLSRDSIKFLKYIINIVVSLLAWTKPKATGFFMVSVFVARIQLAGII